MCNVLIKVGQGSSIYSKNKYITMLNLYSIQDYPYKFLKRSNHITKNTLITHGFIWSTEKLAIGMTFVEN